MGTTSQCHQNRNNFTEITLSYRDRSKTLRPCYSNSTISSSYNSLAKSRNSSSDSLNWKETFVTLKSEKLGKDETFEAVQSQQLRWKRRENKTLFIDERIINKNNKIKVPTIKSDVLKSPTQQSLVPVPRNTSL